MSEQSRGPETEKPQRDEARARYKAGQQQIRRLGDEAMAEQQRIPGLRHQVQRAEAELRNFEAMHPHLAGYQ